MEDIVPSGGCHRVPSQATRVCVALSVSMLCIALAYGLLFCTVFDLTRPARQFDVEYLGGKMAVLGPTPRWVFCRPSYADMYYKGNEWPFVVFSPLCNVWVQQSGYVRP